jgi:hypothetical protein
MSGRRRSDVHRAAAAALFAAARFVEPEKSGRSMVPKSGHRFSEKIMLK